jgi:enamine deaminase RidA (YjgF/YER057c/UK114 family)
MDLHATLSTLNLTLPPAVKPVAAYIPAREVDGRVYLSGQVPMKDGKLLATGPVSSAVSLERAQAAAAQCVLNALAALDAHLQGDWSRFVQVVRVGVFVASDNSFTDQPKVANGASDLLVKVFGEAGRHARAAVGVNVLPLGASVEVEMIVEVAPAKVHSF